ncbi:MAG: GatB/YqeY domain-containing protein [Oligoflexia bacterium]|nr:GatB/YqeY domain-containing protein [Oligoflexia bacterium]
MGLVMKAVMAKAQGMADGKPISEVVKSKLS